MSERVLHLTRGRQVRLATMLEPGMCGTVYMGIAGGTWAPQAVAVRRIDSLAAPIRERLGELAGALVRVRDERVGTLLDYNLSEDEAFLISEWVEGCSLEHFVDSLRQAGMGVPQELGIVIALEVALGLAAAEREGVVHGNLMGRDVLLAWSGAVKVTDFGLGGLDTRSSGVDSQGRVASRMVALAPELVQGVSPNARSDVFALGVLMHEMLVGPRFGGPCTTGRAAEFVRTGFVRPGLLENQLVGPLRSLLRRMVDRDPKKRPANAAEVAQELASIAHALGVDASTRAVARALDSLFMRREGRELPPGPMQAITRSREGQPFSMVPTPERDDRAPSVPTVIIVPLAPANDGETPFSGNAVGAELRSAQETTVVATVVEKAPEPEPEAVAPASVVPPSVVAVSRPLLAAVPARPGVPRPAAAGLGQAPKPSSGRPTGVPRPTPRTPPRP